MDKQLLMGKFDELVESGEIKTASDLSSHFVTEEVILIINYISEELTLIVDNISRRLL